jgi:hypothetical protein
VTDYGKIGQQLLGKQAMKPEMGAADIIVGVLGVIGVVVLVIVFVWVLKDRMLNK